MSPEALSVAADLAVGARERSLLVVLAYRDDPPLAAVSRWARELERRGAGRLALRPLAANGVREIAALYAGPQAASAPVDRLLEASGGVPRRIHELVADWATRDTVERVGARAGRMATGRGELRQLESELVSDVVDVHVVREKAELYSPAPRREEPGGGDDRRIPVCPFKGLASFEAFDVPAKSPSIHQRSRSRRTWPTSGPGGIPSSKASAPRNGNRGTAHRPGKSRSRLEVSSETSVVAAAAASTSLRRFFSPPAR